MGSTIFAEKREVILLRRYQLPDGKINIEIYSPQRLMSKDEIDSVIIPGEDGDFEVLPGHFAYMASLRIGELITFKQNDEKYFSINLGTAEIRNDSVTILTKSSESKTSFPI